MKKLITSLAILFLSAKLFACSCAFPTFNDNFARAAFVGLVKVNNVHADPQNSDVDVLDITIVDLFKGKPVKEIRASGKNTSCDIGIQKNTVWLVFATENNKGELVFGYCSAPEQYEGRVYDEARYPGITKKIAEERKFVLKILTGLRDKKITLTNTDAGVFSFYEHLRSIKNVDVKEKQFAVYQLKVNKERVITSVKPLLPFVNAQISAQVLKKLKGAALRKPRNKAFPAEETMNICLFAFPAEQSYPGFIGPNLP
ncbi:hypothetical protein GWC95_00160 [Sediminibacterium roseum]|uniref:Lipoprotein n=1 Tax=Sediminibacterium roseum TaxID=1978412 RepID=A0ABW9ZRF8_9BACT|nr:hypothetical protein [Sediminibacterium roseum]NCI48312.1 hypothetical protein [Sediminibacterium roseum]